MKDFSSIIVNILMSQLIPIPHIFTGIEQET